MKKFFLLLAAIIMTASVVLADDNIVEIPFKKVPDLGQRTVTSYFPNNTVVKCVKDKSKDMKNHTCVLLDNGATLEFDKDGHWMIVDCRDSDNTIPMRMINGKIQMFLSKNYPDIDVVFMGREIKNGDITLLLKDGTELHFTNENEIIR
ncbi:MAG: PepSY-like domain-containing protein [Muribaculaceae bacterium]|nr:PepSY-like domain-containing protein [Muribaculaceae bacterium]